MGKRVKQCVYGELVGVKNQRHTHKRINNTCTL